MSTYEISKSSLLSLKVEILKKQEEINKSKLENKSFVPASSSNVKKGTKLTKNKGVDDRGGKDYEEDPDLLRKSRQMLEAKSKLYDKLSKKQSNFEENKHYLVNFNQKSTRRSKINDECPNFDDEPDDIDKYPNPELADEPAENAEHYDDDNVDSDDEWTEYTDSLGRTRTCLKKDLTYMKNKDERFIGQPSTNIDAINNKQEVIIENNNQEKGENVDEEFNYGKSELLSNDMKSELLRQQWEKEEATLAQKDNVHYQDVLFNEARTHGVGYFAFSKDETERAKQQAELEKLRQETAQKQREAQGLKKTREKLLKNRIRAAQNRKRARLGLPPIESDEETEEVTLAVTKPAELTEEEKEREFKRQQHVRPWDIGKEGVEVPKEHYIYSQEEWVAKKRGERNQEFAPPKVVDDLNTRKRSFKSREATKRFRGNSTKVAAHVNPYKSNELLMVKSDSDSDSSSNSSEGSEDRLMQAYRKETKPASPKKISFKVSAQKAQPPNFAIGSSLAAANAVELAAVSPIVSKSSSFVTAKVNDSSSSISSSFTPVPIVNELLYSPTQSSDDTSSDEDTTSNKQIQHKSGQDKKEDFYDVDASRSNPQSHSRYAQIAPPASFDYCGPGGANKSRGSGGNKKSGAGMQDSIMMGLKYLREQAEKKGKLNRGDEDLMEG